MILRVVTALASVASCGARSDIPIPVSASSEPPDASEDHDAGQDAPDASDGDAGLPCFKLDDDLCPPDTPCMVWRCILPGDGGPGTCVSSPIISPECP